MIKKGIIAFLVTLACFIPPCIAICESIPVASLKKNILNCDINVPTVFNDFRTPEFREKSYIEFKEILFVPIKKKSIINDNRELTSTLVSV